MRKMKIVFISAVRDCKRYRQCFTDNANTGGAELVAIDNSEENLPIPARYNAFLDGYDYSNPAWFVFAHEDFELEEPLDRDSE